jgi:general L-amino acid transport system substrate-binding protein
VQAQPPTGLTRAEEENLMRTRAIALTLVVVSALLVAACETAQPTASPGAGTPTTGGATATPGTGTGSPGTATGSPSTATGSPGSGTPVPGGSILARVQTRGTVICGVNVNLPGFGFPEEGTGRWLGFDADFCRVVAAAVFGDAEAVEFRPLNADDRGPALQTREIDLLIRNTTWTLSRDTEWGLFGPTTFYDGQGMMVRADAGVTQLTDLAGATICVQSGTTTELTLPDQMRALNVQYTQDTRGSIDDTYATYEARDCDAVTSDRSQLIGRRTLFADPNAHVLLEAVMSKEPLGPSTPFGDERWFNVVKWTTYATMQAEELGIDSTNVTNMRDTSADPVVRRLLGVEGGLGTKLGLSDDWVVDIISGVGNYAEIYNRHLGPGTPFDLERGFNDLWTNGGLLYPPAWR